MSRSLSELLARRLIERVPVLLGPRDQQYRQLFWTKEVSRWLDDYSDLPTRSLVSLPLQANQAFADFISGRPMTGMTKCDPPAGEGVWKLKTPDLRIFGWAFDINAMILGGIELKRTLLAPGPPKDKHVGKAVVLVRRRLLFDGFITGEIFSVFPKAPS